jgi:lysophospholipase L1-like esterase
MSLREVTMSRTSFVMSALVTALLAAAGCGGSNDPFQNTGDDAGTTATIDAGPGDPDASTAGSDAAVAHACPPKPTRVVILGDSITNCTVIGGPNAADCVSKQFFDYVKAHYAPDATYVNVAVGGAKTADVPTQLQSVPGGAGPVLVMIYIGGNDLAPYIFQSDQAAMTAYNQILPGIEQNWKDIFAFFEDKTRFPDGATIVMNQQYNPFDDCTAPPYNLSQTKADLLHMFNGKLREWAGGHATDTIIVDQYTPFLGHGHHYNVAACPHYMANATPFMQDLIHANAAGNKQLAAVLNAGVDSVYSNCQ